MAPSFARSIRQRSSGCSSSGSNEASCPQYSNSPRRVPQASVSSASRG